MDDSFSRFSGVGPTRRSNVAAARANPLASYAVTSRVSPSYGVRNGFIKDPNWPPPRFPEAGTATQRRHKRVPCSFYVAVGGMNPTEVVGDLSLGGAAFTLPKPTGAGTVDVFVGRPGDYHGARSQLISERQTPNGYSCRVRFLDPNAAQSVWQTLNRTLEA